MEKTTKTPATKNRENAQNNVPVAWGLLSYGISCLVYSHVTIKATFNKMAVAMLQLTKSRHLITNKALLVL